MVVTHVAVLPLMATVLHSVVAPSVNVTVPVGVPAPGAAASTVAVKVTVWPNDALPGLAGVAVIVVVVLALLTVKASVPLLVLKFVSPP